VAHEAILSVHFSLDFNQKWLRAQLFQLFETKTDIINIDWLCGVNTEWKLLLKRVCVRGSFLR